MVRRAAIFVLTVTLIGLGPVPLSACALSSSRLTECATPATQSHCDGMKMDEDGATKVAALPNGFCCSFSNAPVSTRGQKSPAPVLLTASPILAVSVTLQVPRAEQDRSTEIEYDIPPPPLQPLLCTFLI